HPHSVQFYGVSLEAPDPFLVCKYMENGDSKEFTKKCHLTTLGKLNLLRDVASGVEYLHSKDIIHSDLKASNVLIDNAMRAQVTDFGASKIRSS
ncbi:kinase-like protein, partial [Gonapodya prolifera JEL478]